MAREQLIGISSIVNFRPALFWGNAVGRCQTNITETGTLVV